MSEAKFNKAVEIIRTLPKDGPIRPSHTEQLFFYSYYKQGEFGDNIAPRPGVLDFVATVKWDAWTAVKGTSKAAAWSKYVEKLLEILEAGDNNDATNYIADIDAA
ncbi:acyl-CoA-binding protein [Mycena rebaudengoi]|nr:acyl-CoA-binding protein [Mycena rebaudengoi]